MKRFLLLFFLLPLSQVSIAQSEQSPNLFLWEIKGPELRTPSYLLGTMHLNDERLFAFSDSLYLALQSCEQFANEIDFTQFDSLLVHVMKAELSLEEEETDTEASDQEEKQTSLFEELDPEGKPTFMDSYLFRAAHNLNKACFGLEDMGVYFEQEFDFNAVEEKLIDETLIDSVLSFKNFRYGDTCPAYIVQYQNDSTYLFQSELHVYCNHHFISVTVIAPENLKGEGYVEQVLASFEFELDENSGTSLMRKKDMAILNDLGSKDSTVLLSTPPWLLSITMNLSVSIICLLYANY